MAQTRSRSMNPLFAAYKAATDRVRNGDDSPEALAASQAAEVAYRASQPAPAPIAPGWWNLPIAATMWAADARDCGAF